MKGISLILLFFLWCFSNINSQENSQTFPDGSPISSWFTDTSKISIENLGKSFIITDYGVKNDSNLLQTESIQKVIDKAAEQGGGVIIIPKGVFLTASLFFKPKTHLHISEEAKLKGSDNIENYKMIPSRIEGQSIDYYPALINAYHVDGFTITGTGTIDGNGLKYWEAFWERRKQNPNCTNLEVSRPRLVFIWNCNNVQLQDVKLHNSGFWTSHFYKCTNVKILNLHIFSPYKPVKAPSTDAIDIDACTNILVKNCYMSVNDDAIALKGGKGPWADKDSANGPNMNIIVEDCVFGFCHSAITCGSESIHTRNIIFRNIKVKEAQRVLWLKMRPDTPQKYEYILVENVSGEASRLIYVKPWKQFFDLQGRKDVPLSYSENITLRNIDLKCDVMADIGLTEYDKVSNFTFENFNIKATKANFDKNQIPGMVIKNVKINNKLID